MHATTVPTFGTPTRVSLQGMPLNAVFGGRGRLYGGSGYPLAALGGGRPSTPRLRRL